VLLDINLKEGSGWDLADRHRGARVAAAVVVFSAIEATRAQAARATAVLVKAKTSNQELLETLRRVLGLAPAACRARGLPAARQLLGAWAAEGASAAKRAQRSNFHRLFAP
jgi:DNA-binding NarL/FixJ family response regulator